VNISKHRIVSGAMALLMAGSVVACSSAAATPTAAPVTAAPTVAASVAAPTAAPTATPALLAKMQKASKAMYGYGIVPIQAYLDDKNYLTGVTPEVARKAMQNLGVKDIEGVQVTGATRFTALAAHQFDFLDGAAINAARCAVAAFTEPFISIPFYFIYKKTSTVQYTSWADIAKAGTRYAVQTGANEQQQALNDGMSKDKQVLFSSQADITTGLQQGRADVTTANHAQALLYLQQLGSEWTMSDKPFKPVDAQGLPRYSILAYAFNPEDKDTAAAMSAELKKMHDAGTIAKIVEPFGYSAADVDAAFEWTTAKLCLSGASPAPSAAASK
jgi:polar amino acid transport system substrate-binding protein